MNSKIHDLVEKEKLKARETKSQLLSYKTVIKESEGKLHESFKTISKLRRQLVEKEKLISKKEKLISDIRSTHAACCNILGHYKKVKTELAAAQDLKKSAESRAHDAELRVELLEKQLQKNNERNPHNISSVLQGVYFACDVCESIFKT